jgi:hypothetical protein
MFFFPNPGKVKKHNQASGFKFNQASGLVVLNLTRVVNWKWYHSQAILRSMGSIPRLWVISPGYGYFSGLPPGLRNF